MLMSCLLESMMMFVTSHMAVPIPEIIRPTMIIENGLAPACNDTPNSKMIVPNAKAWHLPRNHMNHHTTKRVPITFPRLTRNQPPPESNRSQNVPILATTPALAPPTLK